jgi:16S rRNA processing protein RimM
MTDNNQIHIGTIRGAHGVKGLVRVAVFADDISLFDTLTDFKITLKNKHKGDVWLSDIDGVSNKEEADALKGIKLYCDRQALSETNDDEIYHADLIGRTCVDEGDNIIGTVISVDNFGAGDLLNIKPPKGEDFFLSYDDQTVLNIGAKILVSLPEII